MLSWEKVIKRNKNNAQPLCSSLASILSYSNSPKHNTQLINISESILTREQSAVFIELLWTLSWGTRLHCLSYCPAKTNSRWLHHGTTFQKLEGHIPYQQILESCAA